MSEGKTPESREAARGDEDDEDDGAEVRRSREESRIKSDSTEVQSSFDGPWGGGQSCGLMCSETRLRAKQL